MINIIRIFRTIKYLKPIQLLFRVRYKAKQAKYLYYESSSVEIPDLITYPIAKYKSNENETFSFLNLEHKFSGWNFAENGMLWAYNQNYFDWINQEGVSVEEGCKWIDRFIKELPDNKVGLDPYPIALRSINWVKFFCGYPDAATKPRLDSLYSQLRLLEQKLEYHLLGNHLLEDAYALYIGASFFGDNRLLKKAEMLLVSQLKEQILQDGAHFEQSPMYHCIMLDRLLDCINLRKTKALAGFAQKMLGHLECIVWADGTIPMLNDSANEIAPTPRQIFDYAKRLGLEWKSAPMNECGYRKLQDNHIEAIVDVGNITATYQPGHTHADTFNYELRIDGNPFVVDTGISTYNKTERRQLERSTLAHNAVCVDGKDSSEVWGGFRVGKRCKVKLIADETNNVTASHNGFAKPCYRSFSITNGAFVVEDKYDGEAESYIHLAPSIDSQRVRIEGAKKIDIINTKYSIEYNKFIDNKTVVIHFKGFCRYSIS